MSITLWGWSCPYCGDESEPFETELENPGAVKCEGCGKNIRGIYKRYKKTEERVEKIVIEYAEKYDVLHAEDVKEVGGVE